VTNVEGVRNLLPFAIAAVIAPAAVAQTITAEFGFVSASGNTRLATVNFGDKVVAKARSWTITQQGAYIYGKTNGVSSANLLKAALRGDHIFKGRVGLFLGSQFERNRFAGFTSHTDQIAGISAQVLTLPRDTLRFDGGGVYTHEVRVDSTKKSFPAARAGMAYKHSFGGTSSFTQTGEFVPNLEDNDQYRVNTESIITAKMTTHFGIKLSYLIRYDSRPAAGFGKSDRILTTGLQVTY
jgi:putative salt-induced outer membrane protein